jgi:hypothetical protein
LSVYAKFEKSIFLTFETPSTHIRYYLGVAKASGAASQEKPSYLGALPKSNTVAKLFPYDQFEEPKSPTRSMKDEIGAKYFESESTRLFGKATVFLYNIYFIYSLVKQANLLTLYH